MGDAFLPMLINVVIFLALAIPGFILVKCKLLKQEDSGVLSKLLMYVGMPFLILSGTLSVDFNGETITNLLWTVLISTVLTLVFFFISAPLATKYKGEDNGDKLWSKKVKGMERFCAIFSNNGFLGIPLAIAVFGGESLVATYIVVVNIVNNTLIYMIGTPLLSGDKSKVDWKKILFNPVLVAFIIGIILNLCGLKKVFPEALKYSDYLKGIVTPISMTILGMKMGGIKFSKLFSSWKMYYVSFIKLVLMPVVCVAITMLLDLIIGFGVDMVNTMFIAFAMPTAALSTAIGDSVKGDVENGTIYTLGTTVLSVATIPLLYLVLCLIL
ncbi:MAG: AEC family transporter [Clostridiales bacterium]|nr:AEC family transporter [Clostridiales bacterium]